MREDALSSTVQPVSSSTGRLEKRATLCTGPSQVIARSGKQMVHGRVAGVLDGGDDAHLQLSGREQVIQLGRGSGDQLSGHRHEPRSMAP